MKKYCLVCESYQIFDNSNDEDCNRCVNCLHLEYTQESSIVLKHRADYYKNHPIISPPFDAPMKEFNDYMNKNFGTHFQ